MYIRRSKPLTRRHPGGTPVPLSSTGAGSAQLDIDSEGNALVISQRFQSPQAFIEGTFRPAGGTWQRRGDRIVQQWHVVWARARVRC